MNEAAYEVITKEDLQGAFRDALEGELAGVTAQLDTLITAYSLISPSTIVISAADSKDKNRADYICDGTADEEEINDAIVALAAGGGRILLLEGTFYIASSIIFTKANVVIEGQGDGTILFTSDSAPAEYPTFTATNMNHTEIKNMKLTFYRATDEAIALINCTYAKIISVTGYSGGGTFAKLNSCNSNLISSCVIGGGAYGVFLYGTDTSVITNNNMMYQSTEGVHLEVSSDHNIVEGNVITTGINVSGASCNKNLIHGNMVDLATVDTGTSTTIADEVVY